MATKTLNDHKAIAEKVIQSKIETAGVKAVKAALDEAARARRGTVRTMA